MLKFNLCLMLGLLIWSAQVDARPTFRDAWRALYPASTADDIGLEVTVPDDKGCQLCHRDNNGGQPWNVYGWRIREFYDEGAGGTREQVIKEAEDLDLDGDPRNASSLDEINNNFQPGWTSGNTNTLYFADNTTQTDQPPPEPQYLPATTAFDFPAPIANPLPDVLPGGIDIQLQEVAGQFNAPLQAVRAPGINGSLFVVEQVGRIYRVELASGSKTLFHDAGADLIVGGERGLLGLAFHPDYASNGLFYTYQSEPTRPAQDTEVDFSTVSNSNLDIHRSMVVEYQAGNPACNSGIVKTKNLMIVNQPQGNHNGGDLAFGADGMLYVAFGDGGNSGDRGVGHGLHGNGRDNTNVLGAILRIDPLGNNSANGKYGIPNDNPFVGGADPGVDEIFAYGFRNPFRISFDKLTGDLYVGDVGQDQVEEVNRVTSGGNYGWNWQEGSLFYYDTTSTGRYISDIPPPGLPGNLINPLAQYSHEGGSLQSVIGGFVYRGAQVPLLAGRYVFGDFIRRLFYLDSSQQVKEFLGAGTADFVTGFGQDADNELYVVTRVSSSTSGTNGKLHKIMAPGGTYIPPDGSGESAQCPPPPPAEEACYSIKASNDAVIAFCL